MLSRRAYADIIYQGKNITDDIAGDLLSVSFTDNASGSADDIAVSFKDDKGKWISAWVPEKGDSMQLKLNTLNWRWDGDKQVLDCGSYTVDEVGYSGRPRVLTLGAISTPANDGFIAEPRSRTWESIGVKGIANDIARRAGLQVYYDTASNPLVSFLEQSETPDMTFLFDLCQKNGLAMKLYGNRIIIFSEAEYEQRTAIATLNEKEFTKWEAKTTFTDTGYTGCSVKYSDPDTGTEYEYLFKINRPGNKIYKVNENVSSYAEAERLAKSKLRELNKKENVFTGTLPGRIELIAACCVNIEGFGVFDGKYYIDKAAHQMGGGYTTDLEMHKVLEGY